LIQPFVITDRIMIPFAASTALEDYTPTLELAQAKVSAQALSGQAF